VPPCVRENLPKASEGGDDACYENSSSATEPIIKRNR
jgi:hypothetical protein